MSGFDPERANPETTEERGGGELDARQRPAAEMETGAETKKQGGHGRWMMIACCVPMLAIAVVLVATGVAGAGFIFAAVACTAMMAVMMIGMSPGGGK